MNLQQITQWFVYDVVITHEVVTKDKLNEIKQVKEEPQLSSSFNVTGKNF